MIIYIYILFIILILLSFILIKCNSVNIIVNGGNKKINSKQKTYKIFYNDEYTKENYSYLINTLNSLGWKEEPNNKKYVNFAFSLLNNNHIAADLKFALNGFKKLVHKDFLYKYVKSNHIPYTEDIKTYKWCDDIVIVKEVLSEQQRGVYVIVSEKEFLKLKDKLANTRAIVSKYIKNPLLFEGKKFHLRILIIVFVQREKTTKNQLIKKILYVKDNIFALTAKKKYIINSKKDYLDTDINISNGISTDKLIMFSDLEKQYEHNFISKCKISINDAVESISLDSILLYPEQNAGLFLFGADIMLDDMGHAWVLELNDRPGIIPKPVKKFSINDRIKFEKHFYQQLFQFILDKIVLPYFRYVRWDIKKNTLNNKAISLKSNKAISLESNNKTISLESNNKTISLKNHVNTNNKLISSKLQYFYTYVAYWENKYNFYNYFKHKNIKIIAEFNYKNNKYIIFYPNSDMKLVINHMCNITYFLERRVDSYILNTPDRKINQIKIFKDIKDILYQQYLDLSCDILNTKQILSSTWFSALVSNKLLYYQYFIDNNIIINTKIKKISRDEINQRSHDHEYIIKTPYSSSSKCVTLKNSKLGDYCFIDEGVIISKINKNLDSDKIDDFRVHSFKGKVIYVYIKLYGKNIYLDKKLNIIQDEDNKKHIKKYNDMINLSKYKDEIFILINKIYHHMNEFVLLMKFKLNYEKKFIKKLNLDEKIFYSFFNELKITTLKKMQQNDIGDDRYQDYINFIKLKPIDIKNKFNLFFNEDEYLDYYMRIDLMFPDDINYHKMSLNEIEPYANLNKSFTKEMDHIYFNNIKIYDNNKYNLNFTKFACLIIKEYLNKT
jgi:hypothetical protein